VNKSELIIYQSDDGRTRIETRLEDETVWLTQVDLAELFQTTRQNIGQHIQNVFDEGEVDAASTIKKFFIVQTEGERQVQRGIDHYNLDVILSVGYRVKSSVATRFRIWATQRLKEYIVKGFTMNDELLKQAGGGNYFDELLERIRDIRSSEKVFWRKVLDIYATSIDYDPRLEISRSSIMPEPSATNKRSKRPPLSTLNSKSYTRATLALPKPILSIRSNRQLKP